MTALNLATCEELAACYAAVRARSTEICAPLALEDHVVQTMADVSPPKWHLAHTTWFFETFVLERFEHGFRPFHPAFRMLFNSYYETVGPIHARPRRGLLSRPTLAEVHAYRASVDARVRALLERTAEGSEAWSAIRDVIELGLVHEEQHQELLLMDIKHILGSNPLRPAYRPNGPRPPYRAPRARWIGRDGGLVEIGAQRGSLGAFDNEGPRHRVYLQPFELMSRCVTNGEFRAFVDDGGYRRAELWLADGWSLVERGELRGPLYQEERDGGSYEYTLDGLLPIDEDAPVAHVTYFEADAYARWAGARLPTEAEWESVAAEIGDEDRHGAHWFERGALHPWPADDDGTRALPAQMFGDVWEWTSSAYGPYPGFRPLEGSLGEYNGKFMSGQYVLRGGSCFTPADHATATYRNFFYPHQSWAMCGLRLAR